MSVEMKENNTDNFNTGNCNTGYGNTGYCNAGYNNTGDSNAGDSNTGNRNIGCRNTGNGNIGNWNAGDWNTGIGNAGCFNTIVHKVMLFNKPSNLTLIEWKRSKVYELLNTMPNYVNWIWKIDMTEEEKEANPSYKTTDGYLKKLTQEELYAQRQEWFNNLSDDDKELILSIPNFDAEIFKECTGIDVEARQIARLEGLLKLMEAEKGAKGFKASTIYLEKKEARKNLLIQPSLVKEVEKHAKKEGISFNEYVIRALAERLR